MKHCVVRSSLPASSLIKRRRRRDLHENISAVRAKTSLGSAEDDDAESTERVLIGTKAHANEEKFQRARLIRTVLIGTFCATALSEKNAIAYGTGGWKDCEPVCDSLKGGFEKQKRLQEEMMRSSKADYDAGAVENSPVKEAERVGLSERERKKKNLR